MSQLWRIILQAVPIAVLCIVVRQTQGALLQTGQVLLFYIGAKVILKTPLYQQCHADDQYTTEDDEGEQ